MRARVTAGFVCLLVFLCSSCTSRMTQLPVATPQSTPKPPTATATMTAPPTQVPADAIGIDNLKQVKLLYQYWLAVATAADVDPYEMGVSAVAVSPDGRLLAVGGCSKPLEADLRSGSVFCTGTDSKSPGGVPFLLILDANTEAGVGTVPENQPDTTVSDLAFTPDGKKLWRAGEHGNLTAWDTSEWNLLAENVGGVTPIFNLHEFQFTGDGRHYLLFSDLLIGLYGLP